MRLSGLISGDVAGNLFAFLLRFPKRKFTIRELSKAARVPYCSAWNVVSDWSKAGVVETDRVGKSVVVSLRESEVVERLSEFSRLDSSPHSIACKKLEGILKRDARVASAFLFGSVAEGKESLESDIDLAVLARGNYSAVSLVERVYAEFRLKLVPLVFSRKSELEAFLKGKKAVKLK